MSIPAPEIDRRRNIRASSALAALKEVGKAIPNQLVGAGIAKRQTAALCFQELKRLGLLEGHRQWREARFPNRRLVNFLSLTEDPPNPA